MEAQLRDACILGRMGDVRFCLDRGADVETTYTNEEAGWRPLWIACNFGRAEVASLLLERGASVDAVDRDGLAPLHAACKEGHPDAARVCLGHGADIERASAPPYNATPLSLACENDHATWCGYLQSVAQT